MNSCVFNRFKYIRGLLFKFVDFLYNRSHLLNKETKITSSETIFFYLSDDPYGFILQLMVSVIHQLKPNHLRPPGARYEKIRRQNDVR